MGVVHRSPRSRNGQREKNREQSGRAAGCGILWSHRGPGYGFRVTIALSRRAVISLIFFTDTAGIAASVSIRGFTSTSELLICAITGMLNSGMVASLR